MKINQLQTSIESYHDLLASGKIESQDEYIYRVIQFYGKPISRNELKCITGMKEQHNILTHAVWSLKQKGRIVETGERIKCRHTGRMVSLVWIASNVQVGFDFAPVEDEQTKALKKLTKPQLIEYIINMTHNE